VLEPHARRQCGATAHTQACWGCSLLAAALCSLDRQHHRHLDGAIGPSVVTSSQSTSLLCMQPAPCRARQSAPGTGPHVRPRRARGLCGLRQGLPSRWVGFNRVPAHHAHAPEHLAAGRAHVLARVADLRAGRHCDGLRPRVQRVPDHALAQLQIPLPLRAARFGIDALRRCSRRGRSAPLGRARAAHPAVPRLPRRRSAPALPTAASPGWLTRQVCRGSMQAVARQDCSWAAPRLTVAKWRCTR